MSASGDPKVNGGLQPDFRSPLYRPARKRLAMNKKLGVDVREQSVLRDFCEMVELDLFHSQSL